jgi:transcriptional regulator with XRE-family HTH domain
MASMSGSEVARRKALRLLGERVRDRRRERGLTQKDLAERLEVSVAYVSLIERGGRNPPITTVVQLAHALGIGAGELCC